MIDAKYISELADLAEDAYVDFGEIPIGRLDGVALALRLASSPAWPESRRSEFIQQWRVVAHQPNTSSGFSGVNGNSEVFAIQATARQARGVA